MQLFALKEEKVVFVQEAQKGTLYSCLECGETLRMRKGFFRKAHFYHVRENIFCRQSGKGQLHLYLQLYLASCLGGAGVMEKHFPSIQRIADVAWPAKKIVFEIQCSNISDVEVAERTKAYCSIGYTTVWILHDAIFNNIKVGPGEREMRSNPSFFFKVSKDNKVLFYDQFEVFKMATRIFTGRNCVVDLMQPHLMVPFSKKEKLPLSILERLKKHPIYFEGDLIDRLVKNPVGFSFYVQHIERKKEKLWMHMWRDIKSCYFAFLEKLLVSFVP